MESEEEFPMRNLLEDCFDTKFVENDVSDELQFAPDDEDAILDVGCGCKKNCVQKFGRAVIQEARLSCLEMKYNCAEHVKHHHLFMLGAFNAIVRIGDSTQRIGHAQKSRKLKFTTYQFCGTMVCRKFFGYVNAIGEREEKNLKKKLETDGVAEQAHKGVKKSALNRSHTLETCERTVKFIQMYGKQHGLILPGRIPSVRRYLDVVILSSRTTKLEVYQLYSQACESDGSTPVSVSYFCVLWNNLCPNIVIQKPRTELCVVCQESVVTVGRLQNYLEERKREAHATILQHLDKVQEERMYYKKVCEEPRETLPEVFLSTTSIRLSKSYDGFMHYSFDYAQQVFLPHNSQQVGPLYFLTPYKVGLFGVSIEPLNRFVLYVIPEACAIGKGVNSVLSLLDHCLQNFSVGENKILLHADNCVGQNKNNFTMKFLSYQVLRGRYKSAEISFMSVGHTKFEPDGRFGVFKSAWNRDEASCLKDVARIAAKSKSVTVVLVGSENGDLYIPLLDWHTFFGNRGKNVKNIRNMQHFRTTDAAPGIMFARSELNSKTEESTMVLPVEMRTEMPTEICPEPLSYERQQYLFKTIRPYVPSESQDILCPKPNADLQKVSRKQKTELSQPTSVPNTSRGIEAGTSTPSSANIHKVGRKQKSELLQPTPTPSTSRKTPPATSTPQLRRSGRCIAKKN